MATALSGLSAASPTPWAQPWQRSVGPALQLHLQQYAEETPLDSFGFAGALVAAAHAAMVRRVRR
jgi:hypothetical protein